MSFLSFSKSSKKGHYPSHSHGSDYYKQHGKHSGILGKLFDAFATEKRRTHSHSHSHSGHHRGFGKHNRSWS